SNSDAQSKRSENVQGRSGGMTFFRIVAATRAWQRLAKKKKRTTPAQKTVANLENTYKLGPDDGKHFLPDKAEEILKEVFDSRLNGTTYSSEKSKLIATDLAAVVKGKIKALETPRYKIVCNVIIMENKDQSMRIVSRSIWNTDTDSYATYTFRNSSIIAVGYVHAVYFE
ncbi:hypothetical protein FSP39_009648, partial [Pinctada imbricata]